MKLSRVCVGLILLVSAAHLAGCAHSRNAVPASRTGVSSTLPSSQQRGRIVSVRDVEIRDTVSSGPIGTGGALSTAVGVLRGSVTAIAGVVGDAIDNAKPGRPGEEITVLVDDGRTIILVQERSTPPLAPDERVVIEKGGSSAGQAGGATRIMRELQFAGSDAVNPVERSARVVPPSRFGTR